ncbi:MAG: serine/threonine protein kinase, partial [Candidatus Obscuribacterales bacterium]|nr:serine/threonine protein kinase [Candidatus Obscuribacterales bacterium]
QSMLHEDKVSSKIELKVTEPEELNAIALKEDVASGDSIFGALKNTLGLFDRMSFGEVPLSILKRLAKDPRFENAIDHALPKFFSLWLCTFIAVALFSPFASSSITKGYLHLIAFSILLAMGIYWGNSISKLPGLFEKLEDIQPDPQPAIFRFFAYIAGIAGANATFASGICLIVGFSIISSLLSLLTAFLSIGGIAHSLLFSLALSFAVAFSAVPALCLANLLGNPRDRKVNSPLGKLARGFAESFKSFCTFRYPYIASYLAFLLFCSLISFGELAHIFAVWLQSCFVDANISRDAQPEFASIVIVSAVLWISIFSALRPLVSKFGATFQLFISRLFINKDGFWEAVTETANTRTTNLVLPARFTFIANSIKVLLLVALAYIALFALVAYCPGQLAVPITGWLNASLLDANIDLDLTKHLNLRLFIASYIAATGAIPLAVTSCIFLPLEKAKVIEVSSQGLLFPASGFGLAPLRYWHSLKSIKVIDFGKEDKERLCLSFGWLSSYTLKVTASNKEQIAELLVAADEYGSVCKFSPEALQLRTRLQEETRVRALTETSKFSSAVYTAFSPGDRLANNKYRIVRKLAGKALSAVYLARGEGDKHVVIKQFVMPRFSPNSQNLVDSFDREYKILASINNHGVAQVLDAFEEQNAKYIVMEYVRGQDLRSIVKKHGPRSERLVLECAKEIAELMLVLHSQEQAILHRDLTPDNIMEDDKGCLKLIDFGAAHQLAEGVTGTLIGKQCYIAPEQLRGKASLRSDIYSFGCTLYFLLKG